MNDLRQLYGYLEGKLNYYDWLLNLDVRQHGAMEHNEVVKLIAKGQELKIIMARIQDMIIAKSYKSLPLTPCSDYYPDW